MSTAQQEITALKQDIAALKNTLADQMDDNENQIIAAKVKAERLASKAGENVRQFMFDRKDQIADAKIRTESTIKERPFTSAAVAFTAGALLTAFLTRK